MSSKLVVDASGGTLGRVAAFAAKQALLGKEVVVVNCDETLLSGRREVAIEKYKIMRAKGGSAQKGPYFPKSPEKIMKRTVRGMLPYIRERGRDALKRVKCYNAVPAEFAKSEKVGMSRKLSTRSTKLKVLCGEL